jgi:hypothetical protein
MIAKGGGPARGSLKIWMAWGWGGALVSPIGFLPLHSTKLRRQPQLKKRKMAEETARCASSQQQFHALQRSAKDPAFPPCKASLTSKSNAIFLRGSQRRTSLHRGEIPFPFVIVLQKARLRLPKLDSW